VHVHVHVHVHVRRCAQRVRLTKSQREVEQH
jgi:hypothetical protein